MDGKKKKFIKTFKEFVEDQEKNKSNKSDKIDWGSRKEKWIIAVENLYKAVDKLIVSNFKELGLEVKTKKESVRLFEEYIGSYDIDNYIISTNKWEIKFYPIGTIIIGAFGRVNMVLTTETIKLVLKDWDDWRIVSGLGSSMKLLEFNEENIVNLFQENL